MKGLALSTSIFLIFNPLFALAQEVAPSVDVSSPAVAAPEEVIVKYKGNEDISVINVGDAEAVPEAIESIEANPNVEYAEPNFARKLSTLNINDTYKDLLWGHDNTGQAVNNVLGLSDADMDI